MITPFNLVISTSWGISKHTDVSGETTRLEWTTQDFLWQQIVINSRGGKILDYQSRGSWIKFILEWDQEALSLYDEKE
jgi:YD repeat-containing protein